MQKTTAQKIIAPIIIGLSCCATALGRDYRGYKLSQATEGTGAYSISVAADAALCQSKAFGYSIAARGPKWTVEAWRDDDKTWGTIEFPEFLKSDLLFVNRLNYSADLAKPSGFSSVKKGPEELLTYKFAALDSMEGGLFAHTDEDDRNQRSNKLTPVLVSLKTGFAPQTSQLINKLYEISRTVQGIPLSITLNAANGKSKAALTTLKTERNIVFPAAVFEHPKGYKQVALGKRFFVSKSQNDLMREIYKGVY